MVLDVDGLTPAQRAWVEAIRQHGRQAVIDAAWTDDLVTAPVNHNFFLENDFYLGKVGRSTWKKWRDELDIVLDPKNGKSEWIIGGGIGIGKTSVAVKACIYHLYKLTLYKNPQKFFGAEPGSPIVFAFFNIFKYLAEDVSYQLFENYLGLSPYFQLFKKPVGKGYKFPNGIEVAIGAQAAHALGQNIFVVLLDEANFGTRPNTNIENEKGQVERAYIGARDRMVSRFLDPVTATLPGLICLVSSLGDELDFLSQHMEVAKHDAHTHISAYPIWEVKPGFDMSRTFFVMVGDRYRRSEILADDAPKPAGYTVLTVPSIFKQQFERDIDTAIQNIAGHATYGSRLLIPQRDRVYDGLKTSTPRNHPFTVTEAHLGVGDDTTLVDILRLDELVTTHDKVYQPRWHPSLARFFRADLSRNKDATGLTMGCLGPAREVIRLDPDGNEYKVRAHTLWIDFMLRVRPLSGDEIDFGKIRNFILYLRRVLRFPITRISGDQFTWPLLQELRKQNFDDVLQLSVDADMKPYLLLKELHLDDRIDFYDYEPYLTEVTTLKRIPMQRAGLGEGREKVDHGPKGSKDVTDAVSGMAYHAMITEGSEHMPVGLEDPAALRREVQRPADFEREMVIPTGYGQNPLAAFFKQR